MKKLFKKLSTVICALVLCVLCLTGCSWLEIDKQKYYNQVVVTVGDKDFNKKDLVEAFSSYGYQYYQQYGYTLEQSINETINSMIDRYLLLEEVKSELDIKGDEKIKFDKEVRKSVYDYMQDSIFTFEEKIRKEWDMTINIETPEEEKSLRDEETEYTPSTKYYLGEVTRIREEKKVSNVLIDNLSTHFTKNNQIITDEKVSNEAWTRYIKSLQDVAKSEGRSTDEAEVLLHEEERLIELMSNNKYLELFEDKFYNETPVYTDMVLNYFREQYRNQKALYEADESAYHTAMKDASKNYIYYHPNSGEEYVNVKHILINFSQEQKDKVTSLDTRMGVSTQNTDEDKKIQSTDEYKKQMEIIAQDTYSTFEVDKLEAIVGETSGKDRLHFTDVYNIVKNYVEQGVTLEEKSSRFDNLIYIFNDDPGIMNSEFDYVVNLDTKVTDQMVKPFADGVRELDTMYKGTGAGSMKWIISSYGIHIIFHDGNAKNIVSESTLDNDAKLLEILCNTYTTPDSNKSIFNYLYDKLAVDETIYNNLTAQMIENAMTRLKKQNIEIVYYKANYKDLYE